MQRRTFFGAAFAGLGSAATARPAKAKAGGIPMRTLGKTGAKLTCIGMGGARFHMISMEEGVTVARRAYELGINYFDMARAYGDGLGEHVYGNAIPPFRKDIFLTSKSEKRTAKEAEQELNLSLNLMKTDHLDLWQMHGIRMSDIDRIFAPGGAIEAFEAAKKAGKCRFIVYTGCRDPKAHVEMLKHAERFDTALMPLHVADTSYSTSPDMSFVQTALPAAIERGVGILGIKVFGNAFLLRTFSASNCLRYSLSLPGVTACPLGFNTIGQLEDDVRVAQNFRPLSDEEKSALERRAGSKGWDIANGPALEYWKIR